MRLRLLTCIVLGLLLLRAYVPVGFMPASGAPFTLEICPDGLADPAAVIAPAHVHHPGMVMPAGAGQHGGHGAFDHCPFGSSPASGPLGAGLPLAPFLGVATAAAPVSLPIPFGAMRERAHLPRGPPSPA